MSFPIEQLEALNCYFENFLTDNRKVLIDRNLSMRTRYLTVVLEDIFQSQNASAVVRSADCFGVQDVYVIENYNHFHLNKDVVRGASQWVTVNRYNTGENNTKEALTALKNDGYRIVATSPHKGGISLHDFDLAKGKVAVVFGSEHLGISETTEQMADEFMFIPMVGFTESLNISVSAALVMHHLMAQLHRSDLPWHLSQTDYTQIKNHWLKHSLKRPELLIDKFLQLQRQ